MTREEFRLWLDLIRRMWARSSKTNLWKNWAEKIRPFDSKLADLYAKQGELHDQIVAHVNREM